MYNVENWAEMNDNKIKKFTKENFWKGIMEDKASMVQRKFLKYIMGVTRTCPNAAVMGDTGEVPLILKGYRLMIQYWNRITNLPDETLVKQV